MIKCRVDVRDCDGFWFCASHTIFSRGLSSFKVSSGISDSVSTSNSLILGCPGTLFCFRKHFPIECPFRPHLKHRFSFFLLSYSCFERLRYPFLIDASRSIGSPRGSPGVGFGLNVPFELRFG